MAQGEGVISGAGGGTCLRNETSELWPVTWRWGGPGPSAVVKQSVHFSMR